MSLAIVFFLLLLSSSLEVLLTKWDSLYGLGFALASLLAVTVDGAFIWLSLGLFALHVFVLSFDTCCSLALTSAAREREGLIEVLRWEHELNLARSIRSLN
ncbi:MAG: hypothetical protein Q4E09_05625 [Eubacteriales bacterium]|nr:hypothetical protein [Eubacteriales bacterium]